MDITHGTWYEWLIDAEGQLEGSLKGGYFESNEPGRKLANPVKLTVFDIDGPGIGRFWCRHSIWVAVYKMDVIFV